MASAAPTPTAADAMRQSAWCSVIPRDANSRRHRPARWPSAAPNGAKRSAPTSRRASGSSSGWRPRQISSTDTADTHGSTPTREGLGGAQRRGGLAERRSGLSSPTAGGTRSARPSRVAMPLGAHPCGGTVVPLVPPSQRSEPNDASISSQRCSSSSPRRMSAVMNALRRLGPARGRYQRPISSSSCMCKRMCVTIHIPPIQLYGLGIPCAGSSTASTDCGGALHGSAVVGGRHHPRRVTAAPQDPLVLESCAARTGQRTQQTGRLPFRIDDRLWALRMRTSQAPGGSHRSRRDRCNAHDAATRRPGSRVRAQRRLHQTAAIPLACHASTEPPSRSQGSPIQRESAPVAYISHR